MKWTESPSYAEDTLVETIQQGKRDGYTIEFTFKYPYLEAEGRNYKPGALKIVAKKRFEGLSNPADSMIYFRIETDTGKKGFFISAYGVSADPSAHAFLMQIPVNLTV